MSNNQDMDWAAVAAKGANQSPEEARAPPVDTVIPTTSVPTTNLVDVDSGVTVVPPDFLEQPVKTETQATRIELESAAAEQAAQNQQEQQQSQNQNQNHKDGKASGDKKGAAKKQAKNAEEYAERNPVKVINSVLGAVAAVVLGYGAWRKYRGGELTWRVVGWWGVGVAAMVGVDVVATRFYLKRSSQH